MKVKYEAQVLTHTQYLAANGWEDIMKIDASVELELEV